MNRAEAVQAVAQAFGLEAAVAFNQLLSEFNRRTLQVVVLSAKQKRLLGALQAIIQVCGPESEFACGRIEAALVQAVDSARTVITKER